MVIGGKPFFFFLKVNVLLYWRLLDFNLLLQGFILCDWSMMILVYFYLLFLTFHHSWKYRLKLTNSPNVAYSFDKPSQMIFSFHSWNQSLVLINQLDKIIWNTKWFLFQFSSLVENWVTSCCRVTPSIELFTIVIVSTLFEKISLCWYVLQVSS